MISYALMRRLRMSVMVLRGGCRPTERVIFLMVENQFYNGQICTKMHFIHSSSNYITFHDETYMPVGYRYQSKNIYKKKNDTRLNWGFLVFPDVIPI